MAKVKIDKLGSARRFGARYGTKPKYKFAKIEKEQRKRHKCPYCHALQVRRIALGIWTCKKCEVKFTGKAYTISKKSVSVEPEPVIEEPREEEMEDEDSDKEIEKENKKLMTGNIKEPEEENYQDG
ncbi:50S ribosomal protein L37ae [Candidatus Woesearchaeota archaeon]|nr:50S ribosomal protein L37ae [Candidatus Woesearchaeota archaeon]